MAGRWSTVAQPLIFDFSAGGASTTNDTANLVGTFDNVKAGDVIWGFAVDDVSFVAPATNYSLHIRQQHATGGYQTLQNRSGTEPTPQAATSNSFWQLGTVETLATPIIIFEDTRVRLEFDDTPNGTTIQVLAFIVRYFG